MYPHDSGFAIYDRSAITALLIIIWARERGPARITRVLNTYSHVTPALQRRAAEAMDEVLGKELIESRELVAIP